MSSESEASVHHAPLPNSSRVYITGSRPDLRVPMREISLAPTKNFITGALEENDPVRVYDTSGPWGEPSFHGDVTKGLPALRKNWILDRGDVEEYEGRDQRPEDDGYLSETHASHAAAKGRLKRFPGLTRKPLRAKPGKIVTQLQYARAGIVTPEMEFIVICENTKF